MHPDCTPATKKGQASAPNPPDFYGRSSRIRTYDLCLPKAALYQAELYSGNRLVIAANRKRRETAECRAEGTVVEDCQCLRGELGLLLRELSSIGN